MTDGPDSAPLLPGPLSGAGPHTPWPPIWPRAGWSGPRVIARSAEEARLYGSLVLPAAPGSRRKMRPRRDGWMLRCQGTVGGVPRRLVIRVPLDQVSIDGLGVVSFGPGQSTLLDAGAWLFVESACVYDVANVQDQLTSGSRTPDDRQLERLADGLRTAAAAVDEILKFLPEDASAVPDEGFWTDYGKEIRRLVPDRFSRQRLDHAAAGYRGRLREHKQRRALPAG